MTTVAVIGASSDRRKFGTKALRAFKAQGFKAIPINPHESEVEGEKAYATVLDYPETIDEATLYVHADAGLRVLDDIAKKGIPVVWLNPGADDPEVVVRARTLGLNPRVACSILAIGDSPIRY